MIDLNNLEEFILNNKSLIKNNKKHIFIGNIGSGKTTLIKFIIDMILSQKVIVNSPTYSYYYTIEKNNIKIIHIDMYRCKNINIEQQIMIYADNFDYCFIEWGNNIEKYLNDYIEWKIEIDKNDKRSYLINKRN